MRNIANLIEQELFLNFYQYDNKSGADSDIDFELSNGMMIRYAMTYDVQDNYADVDDLIIFNTECDAIEVSDADQTELMKLIENQLKYSF